MALDPFFKDRTEHCVHLIDEGYILDYIVTVYSVGQYPDENYHLI